MIQALRHTGLVVFDLAASVYFWCDILGFKLIRQMDESGPHIDVMMGLNGVRVTTVKIMAPDGAMLELLKFHSHPSQTQWNGNPYSTGFTHIALTVDDLDSIMIKLADFGVVFPNEPQISLDGQVKVVYAQGPEGILLEFVQLIK